MVAPRSTSTKLGGEVETWGQMLLFREIVPRVRMYREDIQHTVVKIHHDT